MEILDAVVTQPAERPTNLQALTKLSSDPGHFACPTAAVTHTIPVLVRSVSGAVHVHKTGGASEAVRPHYEIRAGIPWPNFIRGTCHFGITSDSRVEFTYQREPAKVCGCSSPIMFSLESSSAESCDDAQARHSRSVSGLISCWIRYPTGVATNQPMADVSGL
jgi:hypothetical protein